MYNIDKVYLYEAFDDYIDSNENDKIKIWEEICDTIWSVPNKRQVYLKKINFKVATKIQGKEIIDVFNKYNSIDYITYRPRTVNRNSWFLLRQKINNIYTQMCDEKVCLNTDFYFYISTAKRLYYQYLEGRISLNADQILKEVEAGLLKAQQIKDSISKQKLLLKWKDYKLLISKYLKKCLDNYIPLEQFEDKTLFRIGVDYWMEDNFIIKYIGKSLSGYMKNYEKEVCGVSRKCSRDKREYKRCKNCGILFLTSSNRKHLCNLCSKYQPLKTKTIKCIDCGIEFDVNGSVKNQLRCFECQRQKQLEWQRNSMQKARSK